MRKAGRVTHAPRFTSGIVREMRAPAHSHLRLFVNQRLEQTELAALLGKAFGEFVRKLKGASCLYETGNLNSKPKRKKLYCLLNMLHL